MRDSPMRDSPMYTPDMYRAYIRSLMILIAGGAPRSGEKERWLKRLHDATGIGIRSLAAAYDGQWISRHQYVSKNTREKLEAAAANARKSEDLASFVELQIEIWETAPEYFDEHRIDMARDFIARLRRYDAERSRSSVPARDSGAAAAPSASATAAAATRS